jgi:hypothetical protein
VNPDSSLSWRFLTNTRQSALPSFGNAGTVGPFQATVQFLTFGGDNIMDDSVGIGLSNNSGLHHPDLRP